MEKEVEKMNKIQEIVKMSFEYEDEKLIYLAKAIFEDFVDLNISEDIDDCLVLSGNSLIELKRKWGVE